MLARFASSVASQRYDMTTSRRISSVPRDIEQIDLINFKAKPMKSLLSEK